jgi:hypothetical protein
MNRLITGALTSALALAVAWAPREAHAGFLNFNFSASIGDHDIEGSFEGGKLSISGLDDINLRELNLGGLLDGLHLGRFGSAFGLFGGHGGFHGGGLLGSLAPDLAQARFEDRFADIVADYDDGLANIEDYYNSDEYDNVLDDMGRLVDRYDWFVIGVEKQVDYLGDAIDRSNERLDYFDDLLAEYQERDDLSEKRLARIEDWITTIQDGIQFKIDLLSDRQTDLTEGLPIYEAFQTEITDYLAEITTAGGTTGEEEAAAALALAASTPLAAAVASGEVVGPEPVANAAAVPEPNAAVLALLAAGGIAARTRRRAGGASMSADVGSADVGPARDEQTCDRAALTGGAA